MSDRSIPVGLISVGFQKISLSGTAVYTLNSTCDGADMVIMSVEAATVRARFDGSAPAASTGVLYLATNSPHTIQLANASNFKVTAVSGSPVVQVAAFRFAG